MHRGSSKETGAVRPGSENLPLSASPGPWTVSVEVARAGRSVMSELSVGDGTLVREVVRAVGESPEGCLVLANDTPIPLDTRVGGTLRLTVVPTFSGG